jgi:hypothetical protein
LKKFSLNSDSVSVNSNVKIHKLNIERDNDADSVNEAKSE